MTKQVSNPLFHHLPFSGKKERLQTLALIQIGTFLEYFDLYLYIHMADLGSLETQEHPPKASTPFLDPEWFGF